MADLCYPVELRSIANELEQDPKWEDSPQVNILHGAADLIERLAPKPMTAEEACEVFRRFKHRGHGDAWKARAGTVYAFTHQTEASSNVYFSDFEACCIARGLLERESAEKEAANV